MAPADSLVYTDLERRARGQHIKGFTQGPSIARPGLRQAPVAQLDRASDYESEGQRFESSRVCHFFQNSLRQLKKRSSSVWDDGPAIFDKVFDDWLMAMNDGIDQRSKPSAINCIY